MTKRVGTLAVVLGLSGLLLAGILADASRRRAARDAEPQHEALVRVVGLGDLALSSSARWLRHPSQAEPGAATADLPSSLDVDPAGALIGPPTEVLRAGAPR